MGELAVRDSYRTLWSTELTVGLGRYVLTEDLQHWVNDALMAIFFFVVGLEIKREVVHGDLPTSGRRRCPPSPPQAEWSCPPIAVFYTDDLRPVFALANAVVELRGDAFDGPGAAKVTIGVVIGLVAGKTLGITGAAWLSVRIGLGRLPEGATWPMVAGSPSSPASASPSPCSSPSSPLTPEDSKTPPNRRARRLHPGRRDSAVVLCQACRLAEPDQ